MSIHVMSLAVKQTSSQKMTRFVLIALCDNSNKEGMAWPSVRSISDWTGLGERSIRASLAELRSMGEIVAVENVKGGRGKATHYRILVGLEGFKKPALDAAFNTLNPAPDATLHDVQPLKPCTPCTHAPDAGFKTLQDTTENPAKYAGSYKKPTVSHIEPSGTVSERASKPADLFKLSDIIETLGKPSQLISELNLTEDEFEDWVADHDEWFTVGKGRSHKRSARGWKSSRTKWLKKEAAAQRTHLRAFNRGENSNVKPKGKIASAGDRLRAQLGFGGDHEASKTIDGDYHEVRSQAEFAGLGSDRRR